MMKKLRDGLLCVAALVAILSSGTSAHAALAYSFEPGLEGFTGTPGVTVTLETSGTGATTPPNSLKAEMVTGAFFEGVRDFSGVPAVINDPPGVQSILFDLTIDTGEEFTGAFASLGVTIFGADSTFTNFGNVQFADFEPIEGKAAGTYTDVQIDLTSGTHPFTFATNQSFNDIFGGPGPNDLVVTGFQFFLNKSTDAPLTIYIDNVRTVVPEPTTSLLLGLGVIVAGFAGRRR